MVLSWNKFSDFFSLKTSTPEESPRRLASAMLTGPVKAQVSDACACVHSHAVVNLPCMADFGPCSLPCSQSAPDWGR